MWLVCLFFCFSFIGFRMHPHHLLCTLVNYWVLRVTRAFTIGNPLGCRGSVCVEMMTTLHGSAPSLLRHAEGYIPSEGMIASARDPLKSTHFFLESPYPYRLSLWPIRIPFLHVGAFVGLQSRVSSNRFRYLRSSLFYICLELDIRLNTSRLPSCIVDRHSL